MGPIKGEKRKSERMDHLIDFRVLSHRSSTTLIFSFIPRSFFICRVAFSLSMRSAYGELLPSFPHLASLLAFASIHITTLDHFSLSTTEKSLKQH